MAEGFDDDEIKDFGCSNPNGLNSTNTINHRDVYYTMIENMNKVRTALECLEAQENPTEQEKENMRVMYEMLSLMHLQIVNLEPRFSKS